tara:strand:+ start:938 stop:2308 length:1371 start_codon:yes stop_codon:yes gene_type:complete
MADALNQYGPTFQIKLISALLRSNEFTSTIIDILEGDYFESDANKWIARVVKDYYIKYKTAPTMEVFKIKSDDIKNDVLKVSVVENLKDVFRHIESPDLEFVQETALDFCKNQVLKTAIIESVDLLEQKDYGSIKSKIDTAMRAGAEKDLGHEYLESLTERLTKSTRLTLKTPWDSITEIMDGGLGEGELGVIVAPAGIGKSWTLQSIGSHAVREGKKVVHYTLELNQNYVGLRYDTIFSGIPTGNLKYSQEEVEAKLKNLPGYLLIKYFPTKSASTQTLASHIKQMELVDNKPDMIIVDYADIMKPIGNFKEKRHAIGNIYEELRGMAGEFKCPVWTASQANRSSLEEDIIDASKVAEDYSKVMTADFVMSMSRKVEDKIANTGRFHVIKNRFGVDGITFPSTINTNTGYLNIYEASSKSGKETQAKMNNHDEFLRKTIGQKYQDYKKKDTKGFD